MIPTLYTAEDVVFPAPTTDFGRRVLAAAIKHELMLPVIGGEGAHILGRVTLGELTAFAAEFAAATAGVTGLDGQVKRPADTDRGGS